MITCWGGGTTIQIILFGIALFFGGAALATGVFALIDQVRRP